MLDSELDQEREAGHFDVLLGEKIRRASYYLFFLHEIDISLLLCNYLHAMVLAQ